MSTLHIFRGLPGSGKTRHARKLQEAGGGSLAGRDHIRALLYGKPGQKLSYFEENRVTAVQDEIIREGLRNQGHVYVDDMNLRPKYVKRLIDLAMSEGATYSIYDFTDVSVEDCIEGDKITRFRDHAVGEDVIRDLHKRFIKGKPSPLPVPDPSPVYTHDFVPYTAPHGAQKSIIIDIDGTLAHKHESRDIYDGSLAQLDHVDLTVLHTILLYQLTGFRLIFMSGRDDTWYYVTHDWLAEALQNDDFELHMRPAGDTRDDAVVKYELFNRFVRHDYDVHLVLDDRDRVVKMWRELGLKVYQVAYGNF